LGLEPPERDIMERPPRPPQEAVITWPRGILILAHGAVVAAVVLGAYWMTWRGDDTRLERARAVTFCVAAFAQLFFAIGCRSDRVTAFALGFWRNPALLLAILLSSLLQVVIVTLPPARSVFEVGHRLAGDWPLVIALAVVPVTAIELAKGCRRRPPPVTSSGAP
jgi:Ca2+-transporting ATPase